MRALFVAYSGHMCGHGGVQLCTAEFIEALKACGFELDILPVEPDRTISTRVLRRAKASPYFRPLSANDLRTIRERALGAHFVFLNQMNLAGGLRKRDVGEVPVIGLSHGCEITDQIHIARLAGQMPLSARQLRPFPSLALAHTLRDETAARHLLAGAIAISPFDADCERWLGTQRVCWIPRIIKPRFLDRAPAMGRFGTVGTLDHAPNLEGLVRVFDAIQSEGIDGMTVRVVGGPERLGRWLTSRYRHVEYLGPLDDIALEQEARSWNGFIHPIFCLARGCSTKLAGAIAWGMPIVTTPEGRRGYHWGTGSLVETDTPAAFARAMRRLTEPAADAAAAGAVRGAAATAPTAPDVAATIAAFLTTVARGA